MLPQSEKDLGLESGLMCTEPPVNAAGVPISSTMGRCCAAALMLSWGLCMPR